MSNFDAIVIGGGIAGDAVVAGVAAFAAGASAFGAAAGACAKALPPIAKSVATASALSFMIVSFYRVATERCQSPLHPLTNSGQQRIHRCGALL